MIYQAGAGVSSLPGWGGGREDYQRIQEDLSYYEKTSGWSPGQKTKILTGLKRGLSTKNSGGKIWDYTGSKIWKYWLWNVLKYIKAKRYELEKNAISPFFDASGKKILVLLSGREIWCLPYAGFFLHKP